MSVGEQVRVGTVSRWEGKCASVGRWVAAWVVEQLSERVSERVSRVVVLTTTKKEKVNRYLVCNLLARSVHAVQCEFRLTNSLKHSLTRSGVSPRVDDAPRSDLSSVRSSLGLDLQNAWERR